MVDLTVQSTSAPYAVLGLATTLPIGPPWREIHAEFVANADSSKAAILFRLGESDIPFEVRGFELSHEGKTMAPIGRLPHPQKDATKQADVEGVKGN